MRTAFASKEGEKKYKTNNPHVLSSRIEMQQVHKFGQCQFKDQDHEGRSKVANQILLAVVRGMSGLCAHVE